MTCLPNSLHLAHIVDLRVIGGIERMAEALVLALPQYRHSLMVFDCKLHPSLQATLAHLPNVGVYSTKHWGPLRLPKSWRTWRRNVLLQQLNPDVVVNWSQIVDVRGIQKPIVFYEHGSAWEVFESPQLEACYGPVHHCMAVSQAAKRMLQLHHHVQKPITVITNTALQKPQLVQSARVFPSKRPWILGCAGRLVARKNFMVLIAALAVLKQQGQEVVLHIAGDGPQKNALQQLIAHLGMENQVQLLGYVTDMAHFYDNIDVFICPSIWESYGLVAIEAFAHAVPVIGAACDGLVEVVSDRVNGMVVTPNWDEKCYAEQMQIPAEFDATVSFDPINNQLVKAKSVSVEGLVQAITHVTQDAVTYECMSAAALNTAVQIKPFDTLVDEVMDSVKAAIHV